MKVRATMGVGSESQNQTVGTLGLQLSELKLCLLARWRQAVTKCLRVDVQIPYVAL